MKNLKSVKLLSLLLAAVLLLSSCGEEVAVTPEPDSQPQEIAPEFKSYFDTGFESKVESLKDAVRFDGEVVNSYSNGDVSLLLIKESRIDEMNRVCETFRVYNVEKGEIIAPITNVFDRVGLIPENPESSDAHKQINTVEIDFVEYDTLPLVVTKTTVLKKIEDEEKKNDENIVGDYVTVSETYVYYDVYGNEVAECLSALEAARPRVNKFGDDIRLDVGRTSAIFDGISYKLLATYDGEDKIVYSGYDYANESYYYFCSAGNVIKVYDKANKLVYSKTLNDQYSCFVMNNGNILLQVFTPVLVDGAKGDVIIGDTYYNVTTAVIDVAEGKEAMVETDLVVYDLYNAADLVRYDYPVTANTKNLVVAYDIEREQISREELKLYVCDNEFNVIFKTETAYPIQTNPLQFDTLAGGYFALGLSSVADSVIISPEGKTVSFVRAGLDIREGFILSDEAIYDYALNELYNFSAHGVELVSAVGNSVVVVNLPKTYEPWETPVPYERAYTRLNLAEDGSIISTSVFSSELKFVETCGNVIVMENENNGKYTVFNFKCEHILTTDNYLSVIENNGKHAVIAENGGIMRAYVLN